MAAATLASGIPGRSVRGGVARWSKRVLPAVLAVVGLVATGIPAGAATVPDPPTIGPATAGVASISVSFTAPVNDGGNAITSYDATCFSSNGGGAGIASGASSPIVVSALSNGKIYTCSVTATNGLGTSAPSANSNAVIPATVPGAPTIGTATGGNATASVSFTPPVSNGGRPITSFTASCVSSDGGATGTTSGASSPITVTGLTDGKTYTCAVWATNVIGSGGVSEASNTIVLATTVPDAPTIGTATAGSASASVTFTGPANDGGSPITSYLASCVSSNGGGAGGASGSSSPIVVPALSNGKTYTCSVTANTALGTSVPSASSNAFVPARRPNAPVIGVAVGGVTSVSVDFAPPANDGGSPITSYTATCLSSDGGVRGSASGPTNPIVVSLLSSGKTYTCSVTASNALGTSGASAASNSVSPDVTVPDAPTIGTVTAGDSSISVPFTPATNDGGSAVLGFTATCVSSNGGDLGNAPGDGSPIVVLALTPGKTYTCSVVATNSAGDSAPSATSNAVTPATLPDPPQNVNAIPSDGAVTVTFDPPAFDGTSPITGYVVDCAPSAGGASGTTSGAASPLVVSPLTNGETYSCTVSAVNAVGTGTASDPVSVTPATVPDAPTIGTATRGVSGASVAFSPPADNGGDPIVGYSATCVATTGGAPVSASDVGSPIFVSPLVNGTSYTCSVTATNGVGQGEASAASNTVTPATVPGAPVLVGATAANASISVSFNSPASNGGSQFTTFTATCDSSNGGVEGSKSALFIRPLVVTGLTNGATYTCSVTATNGVGTGPASASSSAVIPNPTVPSAPAIKPATAGVLSVSVSFSAPANNGSALTGFTATCVSSNGGATGSHSGPSSPLNVTSLTAGKTYTCTVTATNGVGTGPPSAPSNAVVPLASVPGAPTIGTATAGNGSVSVTFTAPAANGGSPITGFTALCTSSNGGAAGSGSGPTSPISVSSLTNGKTYTCTVKATNAIGSGPASAASNAFVPATVPGAPTIGVATPGDGTVVVRFTAPTSNGGSPITTYTARCISSNGGAPGSASLLATQITVGGLTNGKSYTCSATATNAAGQGGASAATGTFAEGAPAPPTGVTATAGAGQATVSWVAPANNNGSAVTGYVVTAYIGTVLAATQGFNSTATTQNVTGLTTGTAYSFKVAATNARGTGLNSASSNTVTPT